MKKKKTPSVFAVEGLRIEREGVILREVTWQVEPGQHWVILGANGSGKTSLLSAVTGYLMPSRGTLQVGAHRYGAADWREVREVIGLVSSSLGHRIEPEQTVREIILSGADAQINFWRKAKAQEEEAARRVLRQVHAEALMERPWRCLSQGERQRILIGRTLMAKLKLLFLDEPAAGLDPVAREDFLHFLEKLARRPSAPTLVLITHHVEEIMPFFTHVLLLREGKVLASGKKEEVLTSSLISRTFGAPAKIKRVRGRYRLEIGRHAGSF